MRYVLIIIIFTAIPAACTNFTMSNDWRLNQLAEELELRGKIGILNGYRPYTSDIMLQAVESEPDAFWCKRTGKLCSPFTIENNAFVLWTAGIWLRSRSDNKKNKDFGAMRFGIGGTYDKWSLIGTYRLDSGYYSDPDYYGMRWERVAGKSDQVYARWSGERAFFQIGRDFYGSGLGMALSGEKPFERILAGVNFGEHLGFIWFIAQLDEFVEYGDFGYKNKVIYNRYMAGHRGQLKWKHFEIAFTELVIFGGEGRQIELYYLLPLYALHGEQLNHRWNDNTLWSLDMKCVFSPLRLKLEGILDDFQVDDELPGDREPAQWGFAAQADFAALSEPMFVSPSIRYEMVSNRTFNQSCEINRYLFENKPLGAEHGNDYDKISLKTVFFGKFYGGSINCYYLRKGEGRIDDLWTEPWMDDPDWSEPFPSGVIEKRTGGEIKIWCDGLDWNFWNFSGQFALGAKAIYELVDNFEHKEGKKEDFWELRFDFESRLWWIGF